MGNFDPYHVWLQIPPNEQPPNLYRLLGLSNFESDAEVIDNAAEQRLLHLRSAQNGPNGKIAQQLMNEVSRARVTLLNDGQRSAYDEQLRTDLRGADPPKSNDGNPFVENSGTQAKEPGPSLVVKDTSSAKSLSAAYSKKKKKSSMMMGIVIVVSIIIMVGLVFVIRGIGDGTGNTGQRDSDQGKVAKNSGSKKENGTSENRNFVPEKKKVDPGTSEIQDKQKQPVGKKNPGSEQEEKKNKEDGTPGVPTGTTNSETENEKKKQTENNRTNRKAATGITLNELLDATFSDKSESKLATGQPISMIPLLQFPECVRQGVVRDSNSHVIFESTKSVNHIEFPLLLPAAYDIEATVTRLSPEDGFGIGVHVANKPCCLMIDGFPNQGYCTGIRQLNADINWRGRTDVAKGQILQTDQPAQIRMLVRPTGVRLYVDNKLKYELTENPDKIKQQPFIIPGTGNLFRFWMMSWKTRFRVQDLKLIPRGEAATDSEWLAKSTIKDVEELGRPVDLLSKFNPSHVLKQPVVKNRFGLTLGKGRHTGLEIPVELPDEYDLQLTVLVQGDEGLALLPPIADRRVALMIDQTRKTSKGKEIATGIQMVNGHYLRGGTHPGLMPVQLLPRNRDAQLQVKIRNDSVRLYVNGKFVYGWSGTHNRLMAPPWPDYPRDRGKKFLRLATLSNPVVIKKLAYRPVTKSNHQTEEQQVDQLQKINPSLVTSWKEIEAASARSGFGGSLDGQSGNSTPANQLTENSSTKNRSVGSNSKQPDVESKSSDDNKIALAKSRLQWRNFSPAELEEIQKVLSGIRVVKQTLQKKDFELATRLASELNRNLEVAESKMLAEGILQVTKDLQSFWSIVPSRCGLLKPTQQIEFSESAAIVVSASREELKVRYGGETKAFAPMELPVGMAMKIVEMTTNKKSDVYYRTRGSVFWLESMVDAQYRTEAINQWALAEKNGEVIDHLISLVKE